jgi:hypothetical protein
MQAVVWLALVALAVEAEAAARAVDSVKEGTPRVRARPRPSGEQDW